MGSSNNINVTTATKSTESVANHPRCTDHHQQTTPNHHLLAAAYHHLRCVLDSRRRRRRKQALCSTTWLPDAALWYDAKACLLITCLKLNDKAPGAKASPM